SANSTRPMRLPWERLAMKRRMLLFAVAAVGGLLVFALIVLKMTSDPKKAERVRQAYEPFREDSTFEFTVEYVGAQDASAMAFGLVTKGAIHEGYRLRLIRQNGVQMDCVCKAIAGISQRLAQASADGADRNIGIWLDIPPANLKPHDR